MEVGIDSFVAKFSDGEDLRGNDSLKIAHLLERIELADRVGLDFLA